MSGDDTQQIEVERVARAICCHKDGSFIGCSAQHQSSPFTVCQAHTYRQDAVAAIAALATLRPVVSEAEVREVLEGAVERLTAIAEGGMFGLFDGEMVEVNVGDLRALLDRLNHGEKA